MSIRVQFDKAGWYHPAYGRLGRGSHKGRIYELPDQFGETETLTIPVMDQTARPPRKTGERQITRYKFLPNTVTIVDDAAMEMLREEALDAGEPEPKAIRPKAADQDELKKVTGRATPKAQSAQERTTGASTTRSSRRRASAEA